MTGKVFFDQFDGFQRMTHVRAVSGRFHLLQVTIKQMLM